MKRKYGFLAFWSLLLLLLANKSQKILNIYSLIKNVSTKKEDGLPSTGKSDTHNNTTDISEKGNVSPLMGEGLTSKTGTDSHFLTGLFRFLREIDGARGSFSTTKSFISKFVNGFNSISCGVTVVGKTSS